MFAMAPVSHHRLAVAVEIFSRCSFTPAKDFDSVLRPREAN